MVLTVHLIEDLLADGGEIEQEAHQRAADTPLWANDVDRLLAQALAPPRAAQAHTPPPRQGLSEPDALSGAQHVAPTPAPVAIPTVVEPVEEPAALTPSPPRARGTVVHPVQFEPLIPSAPGDGPVHSMELLHDIRVLVTIELGRARVSLRDVLGLRAGTTLTMASALGDPVEIAANGVSIARGEIVIQDECFGVRLSEILATSRGSGRAASARCGG